MTTNIPYLHDELTKRIAHGRTNAHDLPLLNQLLICQQRKFLLCGVAAGGIAVTAVQIVLHIVGG